MKQYEIQLLCRVQFTDINTKFYTFDSLEEIRERQENDEPILVHYTDEDGDNANACIDAKHILIE